jgi:hypothetical protein
LRRVFSSYNLQLVHHLRNLLEAEGLRAIVRNEILSSAMGELPPAECQAELWVVEDADLQRAQELISGKVPVGPDWTCSACGETSGPQFTQCWRCQKTRDT